MEPGPGASATIFSEVSNIASSTGGQTSTEERLRLIKEHTEAVKKSSAMAAEFIREHPMEASKGTVPKEVGETLVLQIASMAENNNFEVNWNTGLQMIASENPREAEGGRELIRATGELFNTTNQAMHLAVPVHIRDNPGRDPRWYSKFWSNVKHSLKKVVEMMYVFGRMLKSISVAVWSLVKVVYADFVAALERFASCLYDGYLKCLSWVEANSAEIAVAAQTAGVVAVGVGAAVGTVASGASAALLLACPLVGLAFFGVGAFFLWRSRNRAQVAG